MEALQFCVVADGMGGHNAGDIAARIAVDSLVDYIHETEAMTSGARTLHPSTRARGAQIDVEGQSSDFWPFGFNPSLSAAGNRLRTGIHLASTRVLETSVESLRYTGMGTTVVAAIIDDGRLSVGHVGDSRLYVFADGRLRALTRDDACPMRNALTNVVGTRAQTSVHVVEERMRSEALLLLTTDGVHGTLEDARIERLMRESSDERQIANRLVATAVAQGSQDNCTAVVARYF